MWDIDPDLIEGLRDQLPLMASSKIPLPGFLPGTWTRDGHMIQLYAVERPGVRNLVWDVSEVGAESDTSGWTDRAGTRHAPA